MHVSAILVIHMYLQGSKSYNYFKLTRLVKVPFCHNNLVKKKQGYKKDMKTLLNQNTLEMIFKYKTKQSLKLMFKTFDFNCQVKYQYNVLYM